MNIIIDINHPAHVHLLRYAYASLQANGHHVWVTVKDIPSAKQLLDLYGIPYIPLGRKYDSLIGKGIEQILYDMKMLRFVLKYKIDLGIGGSITLAHVSRISRMKSIVLDDDDDAVEPLFAKYAHPYADCILSPDCIVRHAKQTIGYPGTHELAYLHSNRFEPDEKVLQEAGLKPGETFFIVRFNAFKAHHDVGVSGLSIEGKRRLIHMLEQRGRVLITTERDIDEELKKYQLRVSPEKIHSLIYYATMMIGDSQTMTSEAAVLGTPAVKCNSFAGRLAVPNELEQRYGLCYSFLPEEEEAFFEKIQELLAMPNLREEWQSRRQKMLADKIDVTAFLTWFIAHYPASAKEICRHNKDFWEKNLHIFQKSSNFANINE